MTPLDFLLILLSTLTLHRVWNYESLFAQAREWVKNLPKPALCAACNAFWFGLVAVLVWKFLPLGVSISLAAYMPARFLVWVYNKPSPPVAPLVKASPPKPAPQVPPQVARTVILLTSLGDFRPSYSIASVVLDQARAIALVNPTWDVQVWAMTTCSDDGWKMPANVKLRKVIPPMPWVENITDEARAGELRDVLLRELAPFPGCAIITHDIMFVSWYALFAHALHLVGEAGGHAWLHVPHSQPGSRDGKSQYLTKLPAGNHRVVTVAHGSEQSFADYYQIPIDRVTRIPNARDPLSWGSVSDRVQTIVRKTRLWEYDYVQVYPICTTRLEAKGVFKVARSFSMLNKAGKRAFLLLCNPNAGGERSRNIMADAIKRIDSYELPRDCWAFTSDLSPDTATYGLDTDELRFLMTSYANILMFPSISEADSLIIREAQLANIRVIGNSDVPTLALEEDLWFSAPWGTGIEPNDAVCSWAVNKLLSLGSPDPARRVALRTRNLEVIGHQWSSLVTVAGPPPKA